MKLLVLALAAAAMAATPKATAAAAPSTQDASPPSNLQLRPKAALKSAPSKTHRFAPFVMPLDEPDPELLPRIDPRTESSQWSCTGETSLCYDPGSRRIIYKPARALMPELPGLQRENISVRKDRITFKYSF